MYCKKDKKKELMKLRVFLPASPASSVLHIENLSKFLESQLSNNEVNVNYKEPKIENLFEFLGLQSFNDECEMYYEKVEKVFKKMIRNDEKENIIIEKALKIGLNNNR
ncbi:hypothetical protein RhiirC2_771041 [Rhizophagus irregularis]|uniref:Uncharacterized protein n=1 Tax=Rhizophagus irregularis TaxID=588596 RepID=A0A2N1NUX6_9GLOM|nr:hypothetical protein RhiirC2_771041 [Rhizophagus irregularis]